MATNITTSFNDIYLSAHLPEKVFIGSSASQVEVKVFVDGDEVFKSTFYPYNQVCCLRDLRSIVEQGLYDEGLDICTLSIEAKGVGDSTTSVIDDVKVIYSSFKTKEGSAAYLRNHFLITRKSALLPRDGGELTVSNYQESQEFCHLNIYYRFTNEQGIAREFIYPNQVSGHDLDSMTLSYSGLSYFVKNGIGRNDVVILGAEYYYGTRQFNVYFTDEKPSDVFLFYNAFGMIEKMYLFGATSIKTEVDRNEAICGNTTQFYDENVKVKHEVETAPLTYEEAKSMTEMLTSKYVTRRVGNSTFEKVLITDITSEVTDSNKELTKIKFSWKYAEGTEWNE